MLHLIRVRFCESGSDRSAGSGTVSPRRRRRFTLRGNVELAGEHREAESPTSRIQFGARTSCRRHTCAEKEYRNPRRTLAGYTPVVLLAARRGHPFEFLATPPVVSFRSLFLFIMLVSSPARKS